MSVECLELIEKTTEQNLFCLFTLNKELKVYFKRQLVGNNYNKYFRYEPSLICPKNTCLFTVFAYIASTLEIQ